MRGSKNINGLWSQVFVKALPPIAFPPISQTFTNHSIMYYY